MKWNYLHCWLLVLPLFWFAACSEDNPASPGNETPDPGLFPADGAVLLSDFVVNIGMDAIDSMVVYVDEALVAVVRAPPFTMPVVLAEYGPGDHSLAVTVFEGDVRQYLTSDIFMCTGVGLGVGNFAPAVSLEDLDGETHSLVSAPDAKVIMLDFWATWCPPCVYGLPETQRLFDEYGDRGLKVLTITHEREEIVQEFLFATGYSFPVLLDPDELAFLAFQVRAIPQYFLIDNNGVVRYEHLGGGGPPLDDIILELL